LAKRCKGNFGSVYKEVKHLFSGASPWSKTTLKHEIRLQSAEDSAPSGIFVARQLWPMKSRPIWRAGILQTQCVKFSEEKVDMMLPL
jgi:hypothetical protein